MDNKIILNSDGSHNGYDYVDLGLPSGTKWGTCNIGADKPEDPGLLFQFGCTDGYKYGDINHKFSITKENKTTSGTIYEKNDILKLEDDAAHVNMGGKWKMPTKEDIEELYKYTITQAVNINGNEGMLFTSKFNDKSIFVVFSGYWSYRNNKFYSNGSYGYIRSSEVSSSYSRYAWILYFYSIGYCSIDYGVRSNGFSVRGIIK